MGYRQTLRDFIVAKPEHPWHKGVKMQVHHLMSKKGIFAANMKAKLENRGYDVNERLNLVALPCTLSGACHLRVQLHCGDHSSIDDRDDDGDHGLGYHGEVMTLLLASMRPADICNDTQDQIQRKMNKHSRTMLASIKAFAPPGLTSIYRNFFLTSKTGCCGEDSTPEAKEKLKQAKATGAKIVCPKRRDHNTEFDRYVPPRQYELEVGQ